MLCAIVASTLTLQREDYTQIIPTTPKIVVTKGTAPNLQIHGVTVYLGVNETRVETLTLWHNPTDKPIEGRVEFLTYENGRNFTDLKKLKATWNKQPVTFKADRVETFGTTAGDARIITARRTVAIVPITFPAKGTGSLTMDFIQPTTKVGFDKRSRQWAYAFNPLEKEPEQYRIALKYGPDVVWKPIDSFSSVGHWEVGDNGAYLKMDGERIGGGNAIFQFYPKDF